MNIKPLSKVKEDERGVIYDCGKLNFIKRHKGTISANHTHKDHETLFLVDGTVELTIDKETQTVSAPLKIEIQPNVYHKLIARTNIYLLLDRV